MKHFLAVLTVFVLISMACAGPAREDYYVWGDPDSGLTLSFPDTWKIVSSADDDDVLTIMAPSGRAHAACRVRVNLDRRYVVYPQQYRDAIQRVDFSNEFWDKYLKEYEYGHLYEVMNGAGLGRSFASYALVGYKSAVQGPYMDRMALNFVSLYNDKLYVLECSSHRDAFMRWKPAFMSIAGSIDFQKAYHENLNGHYRDFTRDEHMFLEGTEGMNVVRY